MGSHSSNYFVNNSFTAIRKPLVVAVAACSLGGASMMSSLSMAQEIEETLVTATKRSESLQDIPMAVSVIGDQQLQDLNITDMEDYINMLPNMSYISLGPGDGNVYIRGISSGGESGLGANPSVAVYLDDQPVTATGSFLNPHIYDISRIEVLAGPQGTLFGANAQSGAMRIITNQPDLSTFEAGIDLDANNPKSGDVGWTGEGFVNIPLGDRAALRLVGYYKKDAGYIDNVPGEYTFRHGYIRAGVADNPELVAAAADITVNNYTDGDIGNVAKENFNEATTKGARAALRVDLNDSWTVTAGAIYQDLESEGVWDHDPTVGDLKVQRWMPDSREDDWTQISLKVEGEIAGGTLTVNYADLDRDLEIDADYSLYSDYYVSGGYVQPYYSCYVAYYGCEDPRELYEDHANYQRKTTEVRYTSDPEKRFRWMIGYYDVDVDNQDDSEWHVLGLADLPGTPTAVDAPDIYWTTDYKRRYDEEAYFGEVAFDLTDRVTVNASVRRFDATGSLDGFSGTVWWPCGGYANASVQEATGQPRPLNNYGAGCTDALRETSAKDEVYRISLEWALNDDVMFYGTWGEGYRPGGLNRFCSTGDQAVGSITDQGRDTTGAKCDFTPDFLTSMEVGMKATLLDGRMRFNAAAFMQDWDDFQFSRLDTSISPVTLTYNIGQAESDGLEADFQVNMTDRWSVSGAMSWIMAELSEDYYRSASDAVPRASSGTELPRVPKLKWNLGTRYEMENGVYLQANVIHTGRSYNSLFDGGTISTKRYTQPDYTIVNAAVGLDRDSWLAELYVRNLNDERGEVWRNAVTWDSRVMINRPRTIGARLSYRF